MNFHDIHTHQDAIYPIAEDTWCDASKIEPVTCDFCELPFIHYR